MEKIVKLTESDIANMVKRVMNEQMNYSKLSSCKLGDTGKLVKQGNIIALSSNSPFCRVNLDFLTSGAGAPRSGSSTPTTGGGGKPMSGSSTPTTGRGSKPTTGSSTPTTVGVGGAKKMVKENLSSRTGELYAGINELIDREFDDVEPSEVVRILSNILKHHEGKVYRKKHNINPISKDEVLRNFKRF
jgi:hypothetical protein